MSNTPAIIAVDVWENLPEQIPDSHRTFYQYVRGPDMNQYVVRVHARSLEHGSWYMKVRDNSFLHLHEAAVWRHDGVIRDVIVPE